MAFVHRGAMKRPHALHRPMAISADNSSTASEDSISPVRTASQDNSRKRNKHQRQQRRVRGEYSSNWPIISMPARQPSPSNRRVGDNCATTGAQRSAADAQQQSPHRIASPPRSNQIFGNCYCMTPDSHRLSVPTEAEVTCRR